MTNKEFIESISLPNEEWRNVNGYEGLYVASNLGRICSLQRKVNVGNGGWRILHHKLLVPYPSKIGNYTRYCVSLWKNNVAAKKRVHRIVAEAFIPNPQNLLEIDHIDTDTSNNRMDNLRWCDRKANANNPITKEKSRKVRLNKPIPKLQKPIVQLFNGSLVNVYPSIKNASKFGYNKNQISMCCNNHRNTHKGYQWMFLSDYETLINKSKNA